MGASPAYVGSMKVALDALDRQILGELDLNSRQSISAISRKLRQGRDRVEYRVARLLHEGVIRRFTAILNFYRLGLTIYKICLKIENDQKRLGKFIKVLEGHPRVYWLAQCDGSWDVIFTAIAKDGHEFLQIQNEVLQGISDLIIEFDVFTLVNAHFFQKNYLTQGKAIGWLLGGEPKSAVLDETEIGVLKLLCEDARMQAVDIASRLKTSEAIVKYRIDKLEAEGIIAGYRAVLNLPKLGMEFFKAQLFLRDHDVPTERELLRYCQEHPNITYYIEQLGRCKLEVECEVGGYGEYNAIIQEMRERFPRLIRNVETTLVHTEQYKWIALGPGK